MIYLSIAILISVFLICFRGVRVRIEIKDHLPSTNLARKLSKKEMDAYLGDKPPEEEEKSRIKE